MMEIRYFKAWLVFFLVATLGGGIAGFVAGATLGAIMGMDGAEIEAIQIGGKVIGFLAALPVSFLVYRWSVRRFVINPLTASKSNLTEGIQQQAAQVQSEGPPSD